MPKPSRYKKRQRGNDEMTAQEREQSYASFPRENKEFTEYYKGQQLMPDSQWDEFILALQAELPIAFRVTGSRHSSLELKQILETKYFPMLSQVEADSQSTCEVIALPFYRPIGMAFQYNVDKRQLKKSPRFEQFHKFLVSQSEVGNISRQETVSMIPPLVLDVQSHHAVMDMCAAPGSKTKQLIEFLHAECQNGELPTGFVVANDADPRRTYTLVSNSRQLLSPNFMVTNQDASNYPRLQIHDSNGLVKYLKFDRILCDVPCSGDGTMRKNACIWSKWRAGDAIGLHKLQLNILQRAVSMLQPGGRIVYSTCSFNPIENEAVVAEILRSNSKTLRLLDVSSMLPQLRHSQGLTSWRVMDKKHQWVEQPDNELVQTLFPPNDEEVGWMHLNNCVRVLPHQQNTGGFFIAALENLGHGLDKDHQYTVAVNNQSGIATKQGAQNFQRGFKEDPVVLLDPLSDSIQSFKSQYGLSDQFPLHQFVARSEAPEQQRVSFASTQVLDIVKLNAEKIKIVNVGVKAFGRHGHGRQATLEAFSNGGADMCHYRLYDDFLSFIVPHLSDIRVVVMSVEELTACLRVEFPAFTIFSEAVCQRLHMMSMGGAVIHVKRNDSSMLLQVPLLQDIVVPIWRAKVSVNVLLEKKERLSLLTRLVGQEQAVAIMATLFTQKTHVKVAPEAQF